MKMARRDTWYSTVKNRLTTDWQGSVSPLHSALGLDPEWLWLRLLRISSGLKTEKNRHFCTTYRGRHKIRKPHIYWNLRTETIKRSHARQSKERPLGDSKCLMVCEAQKIRLQRQSSPPFQGEDISFVLMSPHMAYYTEDHQNIT